MNVAASPLRSQLLRVAAVWGTTVLGTKILRRGESYVLGDGDVGTVPMPDGIDMPQIPVRAAQGGWEVDARGTVAGILRLRGRDEDPVAVGHTGAPVAVMPGDYGLLQYGLFSIFFQYATPARGIKTSFSTDLLTNLALFSSVVFHTGVFGFVFWAQNPPSIPKPLELTNPDEYAARFGLRRAEIERPSPSAGDEKGAGANVKDPGAREKKATGGQKVAGAEGKFGLNGKESRNELTGDVKPAAAYGGLSEVLSGETGDQIKSTLQTINTVANALSGLNSANIVLGAGGGAGLRGAGAGGGGNGAGIAFGAGTLNTGWAGAAGGGLGGGGGVPGHGGPGHGAAGNGAGAPNEAKVTGGVGMAARGGLNPDQVQRVVMAHLGAVRACYESEAQRNPNLKGGIVLEWQILPDGSVSAPGVASSTLDNARVEGCIVRQLKGWHFPASDSQTIVPSYPFKFAI